MSVSCVFAQGTMVKVLKGVKGDHVSIIYRNHCEYERHRMNNMKVH